MNLTVLAGHSDEFPPVQVQLLTETELFGITVYGVNKDEPVYKFLEE